jgi:hypothetical protein
MLPIQVSSVPPGPFDSTCIYLIISNDNHRKKTWRVFYIPTDRVPDFLAGEAKLVGITFFTRRSSKVAHWVSKGSKENAPDSNQASVGIQSLSDSLDSGLPPKGPMKKKRVRCRLWTSLGLYLC